jgi:hypothetical protein
MPLCLPTLNISTRNTLTMRRGDGHHKRTRLCLSSGPEALEAYLSERCCWEDRGHATQCRIWRGFIKPNGYAQTTHLRKNWGVHRLIYTAAFGPIPDGLQIDHLCGVRSCCNPAHLEAVTPKENAQRANAYERREFCRRGHRLEGNLYRRKEFVMCATCFRDTRRAYLRAKAEA